MEISKIFWKLLRLKISATSSFTLVMRTLPPFPTVVVKNKKKSHLKVYFQTGFTILAVVIPSGFEPEAYCLEGSCSIQLSYGTSL